LKCKPNAAALKCNCCTSIPTNTQITAAVFPDISLMAILGLGLTEKRAICNKYAKNKTKKSEIGTPC
jgi:hypothetical protein